jgi:hypothetical protein
MNSFLVYFNDEAEENYKNPKQNARKEFHPIHCNSYSKRTMVFL